MPSKAPADAAASVIHVEGARENNLRGVSVDLAYDRALVRRGGITVWLSPEAIAEWGPTSAGKRGGQQKYSDLAIEAALTLRLVLNLPLRQTEGFLSSLFVLMGLDLLVPDHTTLSRRGQHLDVKLRRVHTGEAIHLIVDSSGLSIVGEGEWAAAKHGAKGRLGWKKLHLGVDEAGVIVAQALSDANTAIDLIKAVERNISSFTGDAAYDTIAVYDAAEARGAEVIVPPTKTAVVSRRRPNSGSRDRTVEKVQKIGRRRWKKESGYGRQGTVENAFFRYKSIIGDRLRARHPRAQETEALLACNILNRMFELGRPVSRAIGA